MAKAFFDFSGTGTSAYPTSNISPTSGDTFVISTTSNAFGRDQTTYHPNAPSAASIANGSAWTAKWASGGAVCYDYEAEWWVDAFFMLRLYPSSTSGLIWSTPYYQAGLQVTTDGRFALTPADGAAPLVQTAANTVPLNGWFRAAVRWADSGLVKEARICTGANYTGSTADIHLVAPGSSGYGGGVLSIGPQWKTTGSPYNHVDGITIQSGSADGIPAAPSAPVTTRSGWGVIA